MLIHNSFYHETLHMKQLKLPVVKKRFGKVLLILNMDVDLLI
jgi:hypothetical protein